MTRMRKINDDELLRLIDSNIPRTEIADRFKCSQAAISKRMAILRPEPTEPQEPLKIDSLTKKEKAFVISVAARGESQTHAAEIAYDVSNRESAKSLGYTLMQNEKIREAIKEIRDREIPLDHLVKKLRKHVDSADPTASLRAVDMGLKLHDAYPTSKNINLNADIQIDPVDLTPYRNKQID